MRISILCSDQQHPVYPWIRNWRESHIEQHEIEVRSSTLELAGGDILFLISCHEYVDADVRAKYNVTLVIHASCLPEGRGWSPHIWQILEGRNELTVSLLECADKTDSGPIWRQVKIQLAGHELYDEINEKLFELELRLMDFAIDNFGTTSPKHQDSGQATYYRRRTPEDSRLDPDRPISEQFNLLRVADPERYPAYFDHLGYRYRIRLEKIGLAD